MPGRQRIGATILSERAVTSTNDVVASRAAAGAPEGLVVVADAQTAGRGRQGRRWHSPAGSGLYVSVLLRPPAGAVPLLTLAGGVALCEGIRAVTGLEPEIKWPNDLLAPGSRRKLAGILVEGSTAGDRLDYAVFGYGVNLGPAAYPPEIRDRVTSLGEELGRPVDADALLQATLDALDARYDDLLRGRAAAVLARWTALAPGARGARIEWTVAGVTRRGTSAGIDPSGALLAAGEEGVERIVSGEVRWL